MAIKEYNVEAPVLIGHTTHKVGARVKLDEATADRHELVKRGILSEPKTTASGKGGGKGAGASAIGILLMLACLLFGGGSAQAQQWQSLNIPIQWQTNFPLTSVSNAPTAFLTTNANWYRLHGTPFGLAFQIQLSQTNAAATNGPVTLGFDLSADGTNFSTLQPIQFVFNPNGTTAAVLVTNVPPAVLYNCKYLVLSKMRNDNTNVTLLQSVGVSYFPNNNGFTY
jgi:hypothetical protein